MILELAKAFGAEQIQITAEYSNAVLVAILPFFSDFAHKLNLPLPQPIRAEHVVRCGILPWRNRDGGFAGGGALIKGGWGFSLEYGFVDRFQGPHSFFALQDPDEIPKFYGKVRMSKDEAVQMARETLRKLDIPLELVFADEAPRVTLPERIGTNTVPHYRIEWDSPVGGLTPAVDMEIDAETRRVERLVIRPNASLERPPPKVLIVPSPKSNKSEGPQVNPGYAWKLLPLVLRALDDYGRTMGLPIPRPLTTNHVARFYLADNGGWPHSEVELTNGWRFIYRNSMVNGFYAPDNLFSTQFHAGRTIRIKDFIGKWNLTEPESIALVRNTLAKLNYQTNLVHMDFRPEISMAAVNKANIPRYYLWWWYRAKKDEDIQSKVEAEVDAERGVLKSFYYDDKHYWNHPPPIDVPLSLPAVRTTNAVPAKQSRQPGVSATTPLRALTPINKPQRN